MKRYVCCFARSTAASFLLALLALTFSPNSRAQSLYQDLDAFTARPAVTGYESWLAKEIEKRLEKYKPQRDNLGNVWVTLGSGAPHRLIVTPMDEPGYIVSGITDDGFLRVQRLPQSAPHGLFDQLHSAQAVVIETRRSAGSGQGTGKWVYGVVAGLSTHLQGGRRDAPRVNHPDEIYIDIGASSAAEARRAGVDILDPVGLDRRLYTMAGGKMTAPGIGDRFGAAALVELLRRVDTTKLTGTLTVAFVAQQGAGSRGLDRLMQQIKPDEMIWVGRMQPRRGGAPQAQAQAQPQPRAPKREPGSGVLIAVANPDAALEGLAAELKKLAEANSITAAADFSAPLPRAGYSGGPALPQRFAQIGIAAAWPNTPAEIIDARDLQAAEYLLEAYVQGAVLQRVDQSAGGGIVADKRARPKTMPAVSEILARLVETYGISAKEDAVREEIARLLPAWAKPETDDAGNLILRLSSPSAGKKTPRIVLVAHMDEIGYRVRSIAADGRLEVQSRGGGITEFFSGHAVLVQTAAGMRPGVIELPAGWDAPNFEWPRGQQAGPTRVDVGARSAAEVEQLGIKVDDWLTVPKKYRRLYGTRANGRSFDDRAGCAALVSAVWALGKDLPGRDITFIWATQEEVGLLGALAVAKRMAAKNEAPDYVFAVDTFVSSDSPLESQRYADTPIGKGFVIRAVDNSTIVDRKYVDRLVQLARANQIPVQYGTTGGGNDGATFLHTGSVNIPISWPLRYSHSPGEVIDTRDVDALARIVAAIARSW